MFVKWPNIVKILEVFEFSVVAGVFPEAGPQGPGSRFPHAEVLELHLAYVLAFSHLLSYYCSRSRAKPDVNHVRDAKRT